MGSWRAASASTAMASWCSSGPVASGAATSTTCAITPSHTADWPDARSPVERRRTRDDEPQALMIVEIGPQPFVSLSLPKESLFYSTQWPNVELDPARVIGSLRALWGVLGRADIEMIIVFPAFFGPWSPRRLNRAIFSRRMLEGRSPLVRGIAPELLRARSRASVVVVDLEDLPVINRNNFFLLDRCDLYFKRELQ